MAASIFMVCFKVSLFLVFFSFPVTSTEFEVGGDDGWVVPKAKNGDQMYNQWASGNRFKIDDTIHFKYQKDSVMVVNEDEYNKCRSSHPLFYSNNGNTFFKLDRPGLFYFISGVAGHCERGQKMIIKVLEPASPPDQSQNQNTTSDDSSNKNSASVQRLATASPVTLTLLIMLLIMSILGLVF